MTHVLHCGRANSRSWNATRSQNAWLTSAILGGSSAYLRLILQWKSFSYYWLINPKLIYFNLVLVRQIAVRKQPHAYFSQRLKLIIDWALPNPWLIDLKLGIHSCAVCCFDGLPCSSSFMANPSQAWKVSTFFLGSRGKMAWNATNLGATNGWNWSIWVHL